MGLNQMIKHLQLLLHLASCGSVKNLDNSRLPHALVIKKGMALGEFVETAIIYVL